MCKNAKLKTGRELNDPVMLFVKNRMRSSLICFVCVFFEKVSRNDEQAISIQGDSGCIVTCLL